MRKRQKASTADMEAARQVDRYRSALQALGTEPPGALDDAGDDFRQQMEVARERMEKYRSVYRALSRK